MLRSAARRREPRGSPGDRVKGVRSIIRWSRNLEEAVTGRDPCHPDCVRAKEDFSPVNCLVYVHTDCANKLEDAMLHNHYPEPAEQDRTFDPCETGEDCCPSR